MSDDKNKTTTEYKGLGTFTSGVVGGTAGAMVGAIAGHHAGKAVGGLFSVADAGASVGEWAGAVVGGVGGAMITGSYASAAQGQHNELVGENQKQKSFLNQIAQERLQAQIDAQKPDKPR